MPRFFNFDISNLMYLFRWSFSSKPVIMFKTIYSPLEFLTRRVINNSVKRFFLSKAYRCDEAWENRLKYPIFSKINASNLYHDLDLHFQKNERISVLDIDILFNSAADASFKSEIDDVLLRIRLCPESCILPERATHAAIRWYMDNAPSNELFNTLSDRLNYGLFPDCYLTNLLMDKYLKEKDSRSAVKAAALQMLQEDFDNSIMKALALHSCYNYLNSSDIWQSYEEPPPDPSEEVKKVRVKFVRNPYFDDHFDITDTNHLVGKTLLLFGRHTEGVIGISSQLVGLVLYEKYEKCVEFLEKIIQQGTKLHEEAVAKAMEFTLEKPKQVKEKNEGNAKTNGGEEAQIVNESKDTVLKLLGKINKGNLVKGHLITESAKLVKEMVKENESKDIQQQCQIYKQWEKDREDHIQFEIQRAEAEKVKLDIEKTKAKLKEEEEQLFFFDKEEEFEMIAEAKEEEKAKVFYYIERKKKKNTHTEEYVPPEVQKKKS